MLNALVTNLAAEGEAANNPLIPAWYDIIWSGFWFLIILAVVWKVALPRLTKMLDERSAAIEGNIAKADEAQKQAEAALEEYTRQLAEARTEAGEIREAAREDGKKIIAEAKETAASEAARLTATAHTQIEAERQTALVSLRSEVGSLALDLAGGVVGRRSPTTPARPPWSTASSPISKHPTFDRLRSRAGSRNGQRDRSGTRGIHSDACRSEGRHPRDRARAVRGRAGRGRIVSAERRAGRPLGSDLGAAERRVRGVRAVRLRGAGCPAHRCRRTLVERLRADRRSRGARDPGGDHRRARRGHRGRALRLLAGDRGEPGARARARQPARGEDAKAALVERLLVDASASAPTALIVTSLVRQPRERRVRQLLSRAMRIVSNQRGRLVATVHTATELSDAQRTRLGQTLSQRYGGQVSLNVVIDPSVVGGLRVQIADDVIDGSISARLADLRQKLAG